MVSPAVVIQVVHFDVHHEVRDGTRDQFAGLAAALCGGAAIWCSLGTIGLTGAPPGLARVALLAPFWVLPTAVAVVFASIRLLRLSTRELLPLFGSAILFLPWLPFRMPAATLLWTGPLTVVVWAAVVAGLLIERLRGISGPGWLIDPRRAPLVAALLALTLYGACAVWLSPILPDGDEPHYLILAQSLIKDGDIRIENNHRRGDYLAYSLNAAAPDYLRRGINGEIYSIHAPGLAVLIAPAMWLFGYPGVVAFLGLVAALSTALVWYLAYVATANVAAAWFGWACCALTTPFFFQATEVFPDAVAATCLLLGTLPFWDRPSAAKDAKVEGRRTKVVDVVAGASLAILPWLQTRLAILAIMAAVCVCLRVRDKRRVLAFAVVPLVSAALWFGFFMLVYGTPNPTAPYGPYTQTSPANMLRGLPGLLFDQQFGLIPNAPVYGFVLIGVLVAALKRRRWAWETLALTVPYMAAVGSYQMWWGGTSVPARLLASFTLILGVTAANVWHEIRSNASRALGILTLLASLLVTLALLGPDHGRLLLNFRDGISLWLEWANAIVDLPKGLPSIFRDDRVHWWLKVAIWSAAFGVMWLVLRIVPGERSNDSSNFRLSWLSTWCGAIAVMIAFTLAWRVDAATPLTPQTAKLNLVEHSSPFRPLAFDFGGLNLKRTNELLANMRIGSDRQRRPVGSPIFFTARDVPAGHYGVQLVSHQPHARTWTVHIGKTPLPLLTIREDPMSPPSSFPVLTLATNVQSLTIDGDNTAAQATVELQPLGPTDVYGDTAHRAVRYESGNVFFVDENAYPEPTGFWVAGGRKSTVVLAVNDEPHGLFVRNAPVDNHVAIEIDGHVQELTFGAGEERLVPLPRQRRPFRVRITSQSGFRPSTAEPGSTDLRYLGCWIEIR